MAGGLFGDGEGVVNENTPGGLFGQGGGDSVANANAANSADIAEDWAEEAKEWVIGPEPGQDVDNDPSATNNSRYYYIETRDLHDEIVDTHLDSASAAAVQAETAADLAEEWAIGPNDADDTPSDSNNSKYFSNQSEAWAVGQIDGTDVDTDADQHNNNAEYYANQAESHAGHGDDTGSFHYAEQAHSWATGATPTDPDASLSYGSATDNAQYYSTQASTDATTASEAKDDAESARDAAQASETAAASSETAAAASEQAAESAETNAEMRALIAEGFAKGTQNDTAVTEGDYFEDNAEYFKEQAEAWAVGQIDGTDVANDADQHNNNAMYWADEAADRESAADSHAQNARADALESEGYALGEQNGVAVTSGSPYFQNNAKYYSELADFDFDDLDDALVAGTGVSLATDSAAQTITITATGGGTPVVDNSRLAASVSPDSFNVGDTATTVTVTLSIQNAISGETISNQNVTATDVNGHNVTVTQDADNDNEWTFTPSTATAGTYNIHATATFTAGGNSGTHSANGTVHIVGNANKYYTDVTATQPTAVTTMEDEGVYVSPVTFEYQGAGNANMDRKAYVALPTRTDGYIFNVGFFPASDVADLGTISTDFTLYRINDADFDDTQNATFDITFTEA